MRDVFVLGSSTTRFQRWPDRTHDDLAREAVLAALSDAGLSDASAVGVALVGNCALHAFGQPNIRGQVLLLPMIREGRFPATTPIGNVEAGCATGALALHAGWMAVASGEVELALALGVEKTFFPGAPRKVLEVLDGGLDQLHPEAWRGLYREHAPLCGLPFEPSEGRSVILDVAALNAAWHMKRYGTTARALATVAAKNRTHGAKNPDAQVRQAMSVDEVLADAKVVGPFTRAMCAPLADGAAAVLLCSRDFLARHDGRWNRPAVKLAATVLANGTRQRPDEPPVTKFAALRAYDRAGIGPDDVDVAEVHDATAFGEIAAVEALGFCKEGLGGPYAESGATALGGARPVNPSGGLASKGHPLAASGLAMVHEVARQLRGAAGERQVRHAEWGLVHNAGGLVGFDEATAGVALFQRVQPP